VCILACKCAWAAVGWEGLAGNGRGARFVPCVLRGVVESGWWRPSAGGWGGGGGVGGGGSWVAGVERGRALGGIGPVFWCGLQWVVAPLA